MRRLSALSISHWSRSSALVLPKDVFTIAKQARQLSTSLSKCVSIQNLCPLPKTTFSSALRSFSSQPQSSQIHQVMEVGKLIEKADELRSEGENQKSLDILEQVLNMPVKLPTKLEASLHLIKGFNKMEMDLPEEALALFEKSASVHATADVYLVLGDCYRSLGRLSDAESAFRKAFNIDPTVPMLNSNFGALLDEMGRTGESIPYFRYELDIALKPENNHDRQLLSSTYHNLGLSLVKFYGSKLPLNESAFKESVDSLFAAFSYDKTFGNEVCEALYSLVELAFKSKKFSDGVKILVRLSQLKIFDAAAQERVSEVVNNYKKGTEVTLNSLPRIQFLQGDEHEHHHHHHGGACDHHHEEPKVEGKLYTDSEPAEKRTSIFDEDEKSKDSN